MWLGRVQIRFGSVGMMHRRRQCRPEDGRRRQRSSVRSAATSWSHWRERIRNEDIAAYLNAALGEDDPALLAAALGDVARARGMAGVARETGLGRESLYKALSLGGNPEYGTVQKVVRSLGLRLRISA